MSNFSYATANDSPQGGAASHRNLDVGVTGAVVKASPGRLYGWQFSNAGAATAFVKLYDQPGTPTQADVPLLTLAIPTGQPVTMNLGPGMRFSSGLAIRATTAAADDDVAAPAAGDVIAHIFFA